jgi:Putative zinc-finger
MTTHPEELLAGYVDGTLNRNERAEADAHLASCTICREEVALARSAKARMATLPEVPVPLGVTGPVLRKVRTERPWLTRAARPVALAAAAALVVVVGWVGISSLSGSDDGADPASAPTETPAPEGDQRADAEAPEAAAMESAPTAWRLALEPQDVDYDDQALQDLAREIVARERNEMRFDAADTLVDAPADDPLAAAVECLREAEGIPEDAPAVRVIEARFQGTPAYLGAFLTGPGSDQPPDHLTIYVVSREGCALLSFARQRL